MPHTKWTPIEYSLTSFIHRNNAWSRTKRNSVYEKRDLDNKGSCTYSGITRIIIHTDRPLPLWSLRGRTINFYLNGSMK